MGVVGIPAWFTLCVVALTLVLGSILSPVALVALLGALS